MVTKMQFAYDQAMYRSGRAPAPSSPTSMPSPPGDHEMELDDPASTVVAKKRSCHDDTSTETKKLKTDLHDDVSDDEILRVI